MSFIVLGMLTRNELLLLDSEADIIRSVLIELSPEMRLVEEGEEEEKKEENKKR